MHNHLAAHRGAGGFRQVMREAVVIGCVVMNDSARRHWRSYDVASGIPYSCISDLTLHRVFTIMIS